MKKQILFFLLTAFQYAANAQNIKAFVGGTLIDGFGGKPVYNSVIIVENDRIKTVGTVGSTAIPKNAEVISTEGMSVLPGLWDMHVHLMINGHSDYDHWDSAYMKDFEKVIMPSSANQLLMAGVTSARDLGGPLEASVNVKRRIDKGEIPGPTLYVSGPFIQHKPYPHTEAYRWGVNGVEDARAKVRKIAEAGVNVVKLIDQDQMTLPTVEGLYNYEYVRDNPEKLDDPSWHLGLPSNIVSDIKSSLKYPSRMSYFQLTPVRRPTLEKKINQLKNAGVVLLVGTDSGIPMKFHSQSTWNELDVWVNKFGFDPMYAIKAATYWPAVAMRVDKDYGTISEGKYADIIAVKGDVLRYIDLLQKVDMVFKHGKRMK